MENFEKRTPQNDIEAISPAKQQLLQLEKEGNAVFHGSGENVDLLEPRQAIDTKIGPDGEPAVFASSKADYAIFMAIINKNNCPQGSHSNAGAVLHSDAPPDLKFGATQETLDQLTDSATGWVYIFDKKDFTLREEGAVELVSHVAVKPLQKIRVSKIDLPKDVEIITQ